MNLCSAALKPPETKTCFLLYRLKTAESLTSESTRQDSHIYMYTRFALFARFKYMLLYRNGRISLHSFQKVSSLFPPCFSTGNGPGKKLEETCCFSHMTHKTKQLDLNFKRI